MILYTSGTLPTKEVADELFGIKFNVDKTFTLKN